MKKNIMKCLMLLIILILPPIAGCSKSEVKTPDIEQNFVGRWWMEKRYDNDSGQKIVERISITFYDPAGSYTQGYSKLTSSSEFYSYKWIYTVTIDGIEDESQTLEEIGEFTTSETEIHFVPFDGEARIYQYELVTSTDTRVIFTDSQGNTLDFEYKNPTW